MRFRLGFILSLFATVAFAQSGKPVLQSGNVTPNQVPWWITSGVIGGGVTSADSPITSFGVTNNGFNGICANSQRITAAGRQTLCFGVTDAGGGRITLQNYGTDTAQPLEFVINGTTIIPGGGIAGLTIGTTTIGGGLTNCIAYDVAGILQCIAPANNAVLVYNGSGQPSASTTLPNGIVGEYIATNFPSLQQAITAASGASTSLFVPCGTYNITTLTLPAGFVFRGAGSQCVSIVTSLTSSNVITVNGFVTLSGFNLQSSGTSTTGACVNIIGGTVTIFDFQINQCFQGFVLAGLGPITLSKGTIATNIGGGSGIIVGTASAAPGIVTLDQVIASSTSGAAAVGLQVVNVGDITILNSQLISFQENLLVGPSTGQGVFSLHSIGSFYDQGTVYNIIIQPTGTGVVQRSSFERTWAAGIGTTTAGVRVSQSGSAIVGGIDFSGLEAYNSVNGIIVEGTSVQVNIDHSEIAQNTNGVVIDTAGTVHLTNSIVGAYGGWTANTTGVQLKNAPNNVTVSNNTIIGNTTNCNIGSVGTSVLLKDNIGCDALLAPPQITVSQNDYAPTSGLAAEVWQLASSGAVNITGISAPGYSKVLTLQSVSASNITLIHGSASSLAANRFAFASDLVLLPNQSIKLRYDTANAVWITDTPAFFSTGVTAGACGSATTSCVPTINAQGLIISTSTPTIGPVAASSIDTGGATTSISNGTPNSIIYNAAGFVNKIAPVNNAVVVTSGAGLPSESTTLPTAVQNNIVPASVGSTGVFLKTKTTVLTTSGTFTPTAGNVYTHVQLCGGGAGGQGGGSGSPGAGTSGGTTSFGALLTATGGTNGGGGGGGGTSAGGVNGTSGGTTPGASLGGTGGSGPFGGGGTGGTGSGAGVLATNVCSGGGGGGGTVGSSGGGTGGGAGGNGFGDFPIVSVGSSQIVTIGAAGTGGSGGTLGFAGAAGISGLMILTEYLNQ